MVFGGHGRLLPLARQGRPLKTARAAEEGLLEKLDYKIINVSSFYPELMTDYSVGSDVCSTILA